MKRPPMREGEVSERDFAAGFTRRGQRSFFGYEVHLAVDQGSDLIRRPILTSAALARASLGMPICNDEAALLADKAYESMSGLHLFEPDRVASRRHRHTPMDKTIASDPNGPPPASR